MADKCAAGLSTAVPQAPRAGRAFCRLNGAPVCSERDTMSPSVSIVAGAGRWSWPCGRLGFISVKEIERRAVAQ